MKLDYPSCWPSVERKLRNMKLVSTIAVRFSITLSSLENNIIPYLSIYQELHVLKALG